MYLLRNFPEACTCYMPAYSIWAFKGHNMGSVSWSLLSTQLQLFTCVHKHRWGQTCLPLHACKGKPGQNTEQNLSHGKTKKKENIQ